MNGTAEPESRFESLGNFGPAEGAEPQTAQAGDERALKPYTIKDPFQILEYVEDPADNWLGDRLLFRGCGGLVILGEGGLGKSRLVTQLAFCAVLGLPFLGIETRMRRKRWLFIQSENGPSRLKADYQAMIAAFVSTDGDKEDIRNGIRTITLEGEDDGFQIFSDPKNVLRIEKGIADFLPDAVVIDPLYDKWGEDLNGDAAMRDALGCIRRTIRRGCPDRVPVILHHALAGRMGAAKAIGYDRGAFARNSKVIQMWARAQINLFRDPSHPDTEDGDWLVVACGKVSDGRPFSTFGSRLCPQSHVYVNNPAFDIRECSDALSKLVKPAGNLTRQVALGEVAALLDNGPLTHNQLVKAIAATMFVKNVTAYKRVQAAQAAGLIRQSFLSKAKGQKGKQKFVWVKAEGQAKP